LQFDTKAGSEIKQENISFTQRRSGLWSSRKRRSQHQPIHLPILLMMHISLMRFCYIFLFIVHA